MATFTAEGDVALACPFFRRTQPPQCRAVSGGPGHPPARAVAALCRGEFGACPAYRYIRAAGRTVHPADFVAWLVRGIGPGQVEPATEPQ